MLRGVDTLLYYLVGGSFSSRYGDLYHSFRDIVLTSFLFRKWWLISYWIVI
jgi:hypothetical protein